MGHKIRSKKAPFANLANIIFQRELIKILTLYYPIVDSSAIDLELDSEIQVNAIDDLISAAGNQGGSIFMQQHYMKKNQPQEDAYLSQELHAISRFLQLVDDVTTNLAPIRRWGKLRLTNGHILGSRLSTERGRTSRRLE